MYCLLFVYKTLNVSVTDKDRNYQVAALAWVSALALSAVALAAGSMFELEPAPLLVLHPRSASTLVLDSVRLIVTSWYTRTYTSSV